MIGITNVPAFIFFILLPLFRRQKTSFFTRDINAERKFVMEKYKDLYDALYDESVSKKKVEAFFQYQDGQTTTVEAEMSFYTMEGVA